jgi:hypothetical protein
MTPEQRSWYSLRLSVACAAFSLGSVVAVAHRDPFSTSIVCSVAISLGLVQLLLPRGNG